ncbi:uncharacterized protein LOC123561388 isoform X2 [Mercenaria mercenaria]|nr:uncharacterized protein LOC123561388 isoform X2 [Mercenaria mercenaria]XP_045209662.2 uncharacterized protein LOC123561388 isoform X2 [Mercenaria mercenaria]XP_053409214.1 uncharacterized protein LOC123561388 isoform X2 [Mercenaria mercenaria]
MDFDPKIGAVFSLADKEESGDRGEQAMASGNGDTNDFLEESSEYLLPDCDDNNDVDIMSGLHQIQSCSTSTSLPLTDHMSYTADNESHKANISPNKSTSVVEDLDAPPSLLLETPASPELPTSSLISSLESMSPPILQPEEPLKRAVSPEKKKRCTKIAPCYIVLTSIDQCMQSKSSVSSRTFKRSFAECSNMCKKVLFKRRLKAGKDVFNVKTPSKQKDYLIYLLQVEKERLKRNKKSPIQCPQIRDILEKHDLKVEARKKAFGKPAHPRVRRTISRLPKDFANRPNSPVTPMACEMDENKQDLSAEALAKLQDQFVKRKYKIELNSLKRLIGIKRSLNQNLKRAKRNRSEAYETFLKSDVTSSVSGRVRKVNPKYGGDFAVSKKEIEEQRLVDVAQAQLKRAESANKRKVEEMNKNSEFYLQMKRKLISDITGADSPATAKKVKAADVVIDNPEEDNVRSFQVKQKKSKREPSRTKPKPNPLKVLLNAPPIVKGNELITSEKTKKSKQRKSQTEYRDGVLIQDMPREENVISGFLQHISSDERSAVSPSLETESQQSDQYVRAKQLLKSSLDKRISKTRQLKIRQIPSLPCPKREVPDSNFSTTQQANDQEKYKMLKIPENVQKLFSNKEIKQEPVDDGYESTSTGSSASNSSKVITVAYSNGVYKKVLVNLSSSGQTQPTLGSQTVKAGMTSGPILVNTQQGLRYLVPKSVLTKSTLPSYSDAIKAKFLPVKSDTAMASQASVTLNTIPSAQIISTAVQLGNPVQTVPLSSQPNTEPRVISVLPTVLQVPLQNAMNTSAANSLLRPTLATPTVIVSQSYVNKSFQQTVGSINSPMNTAVKQTHTVVHKVSPVMQRQNALNQSEQAKKTAIHQQSIPVSNTSGPETQIPAVAQNQKNIDKCKFYLLKIDGKNVLIPIEGDQAQPKAYVVNSDVITANTPAQSLTTSGNIASPTGIRPTLIGVPTANGNTHPKPTMAVVPNIKHVNTIHPSQFTFVPNTTNSHQNKNVLQTVTLTNIATAVCGPGSTTKISGVNNVNASSCVTTSVKTNQAYTSVVKSGSYKLTTQPVSTQSDLLHRNTQPNNSVTVVPVFLKTAENSTVASSFQSTISAGHTTSAFSAVKGPLYVRPLAGEDKTVLDPKNQSGGILNDILTQKRPLYEKLPLPQLSARKTDTTQQKGNGNEHVNISVEHGKGGLCEKSGIFTPEEAEEEKVEEKPQAFKEAVTAREERLRRLKELLKEKQKAVEEIRGSKPK